MRSATRGARASRSANTATVGQHLRQHRRGLREDYRARPQERLEQGHHRPPHRPQQCHPRLRADRHLRQPGGSVQQIASNHIHNIWAQRLFSGAEMAGIKFHAAIDVRIEHNRIHTCGGLWMDWMAQGTRITRNLCYDNTAPTVPRGGPRAVSRGQQPVPVPGSAARPCPRAEPT